MTHNPLVPTRIVNKNGVATTVHKKSDPGTGATAKALPLPILAPQTREEAETVARVMKAIDSVDSAGRYKEQEAFTYEFIEERLEAYSPDVIAAYDKAIRNHPGEGFEDLLVSAINQHDSSDKAGFLLFIAKHCGTQDTTWDLDDDRSYNYEFALDLYGGIKSLSRRFRFDARNSTYKDAEDQSTKVISGLLKVTTRLFHDSPEDLDYVPPPGDGYELKDDSIVDLIMRRPEDAERIADILVARESRDVAFIEEMLATETPALIHGTL